MDTIDPGVTGRRRAVSKPRRPLWPSRVVCEYFADITPRSLHRWKNDPAMGFPQPVRINHRDYYIPDEIEAFALKRRAIAEHEAKKAAESKPAVVAVQPKTKSDKNKTKKPARSRDRPRHAANVEHEVVN
jgi:hypothetical protein